MPQLSRDEIHTYAKAMIAAIGTPEFQARVREAMAREPVPADADAVLARYEEVQADFFTNQYHPAKTSSASSPTPDTAATAGSSGATASTAEQEKELSKKVEDMTLDGGDAGEASSNGAAAKLDGGDILEQLRNAVRVYKDGETERVITQLCVLLESQVTALPATVPALKHLYNEPVNGARTPADVQAAAAKAGGDPSHMMPVMNPSPQMMQMMEMAMRTLNPTQRQTLERAQQTMMSGRPPAPEDMRDMMMIQRQLGAFMQTMQQFGQLPGGRGGRGGGRGGMRGGRGTK